MSNTRIPSPARSQGSLLTPRRYRSRSTRSVGSPARSNAPARLSAIVMQDRDSFCPLSPLPSRRSVLNDDTEIEEPRRRSWWKKLKENSRDVIEILETSKVKASYETVEEMLNVEVLSQEKKNYTLDLPDSSDSESINSIVMPQRKLFVQKENLPKGQCDQESSVHKITSATTKKLIQNNNKQRPKTVFASALLNISPDKTLADKTKDIILDPPRNQVRNIFGNRPATKRKNIFAEFIVCESEEEVSEIQPNVFGFQKQTDPQQSRNSASRPLREASPALSITNVMDMDDWKYLPSSTMVENQLEFATTPGKKAKLSKLSEAVESEYVTGTKDTDKTKNASDKNKSLINKSQNLKEKTKVVNTSMATRNKAKFSNFLIEENKSISPNTSHTNEELENRKDSDIENKSHTSYQENADKNAMKQHELEMDIEPSDDENNFSLEYDKSDSDSNKSSFDVKLKNTKTLQQIEVSLKQHGKNSSKLQSGKDDKTSIEITLESNKHKEIIQNQSSNKSRDFTHREENLQQFSDNDQICTSNNSHETVLEVNNEMKNISTQNANTQDHEMIFTDKVSKNKSATNNKETENSRQCRSLNDKSRNNKICKQNEGNKGNENDDIEQEEGNKTNISGDNRFDGDDQIDNNKSENESEEQDNEELDTGANNSEQIMEDSEECDDEENDNTNDSKTATEDEMNEEINNEESPNVTEEQGDNINNCNQEIENEINEDNNEETPNLTEEQDDNTNNSNQRTENDISETDNNGQLPDTTTEQNDNTNNSKAAVDDHIGDDSGEESQEVTNDQGDIENSEHAIKDISTENNDNECYESNEDENQDSDEDIENDNLESSEEENEQSDKSDDEMKEESHVQESENSAHIEVPASDNDVDSDNGEIEDTGSPKEVEIPEAIRRNSNHSASLTPQRLDNSLRKTKSMMLKSIRPSLLPRESISLDGPSNSSAEGSGWDSHRTTRKTLRQTFGKDFTPRKSLRALVMEKSAKRQTVLNDAHDISKAPQANSTELPEFNDMEETVEPSVTVVHETHTRQVKLQECLQKIKQMQMERNMKLDQEINNFLKTSRQYANATCKQSDNVFKVPTKPVASRRNTKSSQSKARTLKSSIPLADLPSEFIEDMKYRPPKRYQPKSASWTTKRLYKFLEDKLEPKYDYKARVRAEKLVETIFQFTKDVKKHEVAPLAAVDVLKHEMARLNIVKTHFEFYEFFNDFMPREIRVKVIPDIVNQIPTPRNGIFSNIISGHSTT